VCTHKTNVQFPTPALSGSGSTGMISAEWHPFETGQRYEK